MFSRVTMPVARRRGWLWRKTNELAKVTKLREIVPRRTLDLRVLRAAAGLRETEEALKRRMEEGE